MRNSLSLFRLQSIDNQITKINNRINRISLFIEYNGLLTQAENQAALIANKLIDSQGTQNNLEGQMLSLRIKIEQTESSLYDGKIKIPKDLRDLEKELGLLSHNLKQLEDNLLDTMQSVDDNRLKESKALSVLLTVNLNWSAKYNELKQENHKLQMDLHTLALERDAIIHSVPENILATYENLQKIKQGFAVCCIRDNSCLSCGTSLTLAFTQAARSSKELIFCPSCGRIIYCE